MANIFQKALSKATFWNKEDDARIAREEDEERKRKNRAAVSVNMPKTVSPNALDRQPFDFSKPLNKNTADPLGIVNPGIGSQSEFTLKPKPIMPEQPKDTRSSKIKELDDLAAESLDDARKEASQGEGWFGRNFLNKKAIEERAVASARGKATRKYQDKYGWNADPEVLAYNKGTSARLDVESKRLKKDMDNLNDFSKKMDKVGQVAGYVPVTGSVLNLGLAGTEKLAKATGNEAYGRDIEDQRLRLDVGMNKEEFDKLDIETQKKLRNLQSLGLALSPLDFVGVGGLAKSGVVGAGKKATMEFVKDGAVDVATKQALKKALIAEGKSAIVPFVAGTGASVGGQAYLGGTDNIDLLEAGKTGLLTAGASKILPFESKGAAKGRFGLDDVAQEADEIPVPKNVKVGGEFQVDQALRKAGAGAEETAGDIEAPDIPGKTKSNDEEGVEIAPGVKAPEQPKPPRLGLKEPLPQPNFQPLEKLREIETPSRTNVPDVTNPVALAKAGGRDITATPTADVTTVKPVDTPMADFSQAVQAPLQKATIAANDVAPEAVQTPTDIAQAAQAGDARINTRTDAEGNAALVSDAQIAQDLADAGIAPQRGASQAATAEEQMARAAEDAAMEQVNLDGVAAPRTRAQITSRIDDAELRADLNTDVPFADRVSLEEAEINAKATLNDLSDEALIGRYSGEGRINNPEGFFTALNAIKRLEQIDLPEAQVGIRNALDAMANYASESGRGLRTAQVVFEDMPTSMKVDYLINKIEKAPGGQQMGDLERGELLRRIQASDAAADNLRVLQDEATTLLESGLINNKSLTPEVEARVAQLGDEITQAERGKEVTAGDAWRYYQEQLPPSTLGKRIGEVGRTLMLSSPTGRVFDVLSTSATTADDILTRGVSNLIGKGVNKLTKAGNVEGTSFNVGKFAKGGWEGLKDIVASFKGKDRVESILNEANKNSRSDVNGGGGKFRRGIKALVETPTNLTRGIRDEQLFRGGMQEAAQMGLKGDAQRVYAELRASIPTEAQLSKATESWRKANMLHDNPISRGLNNVANSLDKKGGGWASPLIRNQIAPFTSWLGGNLHRTLTDKNMLWNVGSIAVEAKRGNLQGVIDSVAKLGVNGAEAMTLGYALTQAGIITNEDANGDSYGGAYFHIGDRYIPVAIAGTAAVPIILGNAAHQSSEEGGDIATLVNNTVMNTMKNAGVASVFGGENNLQSSVDAATREGGDFFDAAAQYAGGTLRQFIPGATGDVNAVLDQTSLNPTGEAAETKVTQENPETGRQVTDVLATELNKTANRIPGLSQMLDRKEGVPAKDLLDRSLKGTRETGEMAEKREVKETLDDMEKRLKKEKVPMDDDAIQARLEEGDYDKAIKGLEYKLAKAEADPDVPESKRDKIRDSILKASLEQEGVPTTDDGIKARTEEGNYQDAILGMRYQLQAMENDKDIPESKRKNVEDDIKRLQITANGSYAPSTIALYSETSQSEWRAMGNPESEDYDPETYQLLAQYDADLAANGVSRSTKSGDKPKFTPYSGSGGSRGGSKKGFTTDIAKQSFDSFNFAPQKARDADFAGAKSAIPVVERVPNYDRSKLKKISVHKGGRA